MSLKRKQPTEAVETKTDIFRSDPIDDRSSKFIGYYSPSRKPKDLQNLPEILSASHKILGWRRESNQQSITKATQYVTGSDDDGEKYGGKRVEKVMSSTRAEGACVVARWYGGVMLGPVRFEHIEHCVREAIQRWEEHEVEERGKKRKLAEDEADHARLSKGLVERDQSIAVLRTLAMEKEQAAKSKANVNPDEASAKPQGEDVPPAQTSVTDYGAMPLERLRVLDRARDATLSFLLKRIDKAEAEVASRGSVNTDPP